MSTGLQTVELNECGESRCRADDSRAVFYVFVRPVPKSEVDSIVREVDSLKELTPSNAVLLQMARDCVPPAFSDEHDDESRPW